MSGVVGMDTQDTHQPKKRFRVVIRPWSPRRQPYIVTEADIEACISFAYPKLREVLYIGWAKRTIQGKRATLYLAATGATSAEARKIFKSSDAYGEDVWLIGGNGLHVTH